MFRYSSYIYEIYKNKSFSKAAKKLYISQPALSNIIKKVESELQVSLFNRSSNPISLTEAGKCYLKSLEKIKEIENNTKYELKKIKENTVDSIIIGSSSFFCTHILPAIIDGFLEIYNEFSIKLLEANADELCECLENNIVDIVISVETMDSKFYNTIKWASENIILAVPSSFKINDELKDFQIPFEAVKENLYLSNHFKGLKLSCFSDYPFLFFKKGNDMYSRAHRMCERANFSPHVTMYVDQLLTSYYASKAGNGISFIRADIINYVEPTNKLVFYKINDFEATRNIMLHYKKNIPLSENLKNFLFFFTGIPSL